MKNKHQKLLTWHKAKGCTLNCEIDLDSLFETAKERNRFDAKWKDFIASDPDNKKVVQVDVTHPYRMLWFLFLDSQGNSQYVLSLKKQRLINLKEV